MDFLARITIYISLFMGIMMFTMFSLMIIPAIIDKYQDIWEDYQRSLEPDEVLDNDEWISGENCRESTIVSDDLSLNGTEICVIEWYEKGNFVAKYDDYND